MTKIYNILILIALLAISSSLVFNKAYKMGKEHTKQECQKTISEIKNASDEAFKHNVIVKDNIVEKIIYQDRVIREKGDIVEKEVIKYVPSINCSVDDEWLRLHNKAASGM